MSLKAWYPLNGDTKDYSGNQNDATNYGSTIDSSGKIGKCYSFDGSSSLNCGSLDSLTQTFRGRSFSACCWVKFTDSDVADKFMFGIGTYGVDTFVHFVRRSGALYMGFYADDLPSYTALSQNVWYHVVFSWNVITQLQSIFINGNLDASRVSSGILNATQGYALTLGSTLVGSLNDVRIYDHALSDKEIKELAKAKILHYTFNDFQEPTTNLLYNSGAVNLAGGTDIYANSTKTDLGDGKYKFVNNGGGGTTVRIYCNLADLTNAETYGCSVYYDSLQGTLTFDWCDYGISGNNSVTNSSGRLYGVSTRPTYDSTFRFLDINLSTGGSVILYNPQIEHKDHVTEFTSSTRTGIIRDCSGYNNSAILVESTTPKWTQGKLGSGGYTFSNVANNRISMSGNFGIMPTYTISFWAKRTVGSKMPIASNGNTDFYWYGDNSWAYRHGGTFGEFYYPQSVSIPDNVWGFYIVTYDGVNVRIYRNAVYEGMQATTGTADFTNGFIIGNCWSSIYAFDGLIDDVRIYATSLSDADVLEIYQTRAALDINGNLFINEININGISSDKRNLVEYANWVQGTYTVGQNNTWYGSVYNQAMNFNPNQSGGVTHKIEISNNPIGELDVMSTFIATTTHVNLYSCSQTYYYFSVDSTKTYRYSQWIYLHWGGGTSTAQYSYLGILGNTVCDLNTTTLNGNPYFVAPVMDDIRHLDKWVLQVYYIYPAGSTGKPAAGALYYPDGTSTVDGGCFTWAAATTSSHIRQYPLYEYGEISVGTYVKYYRPRMEIMDGNEPTITKLLICGTHRVIVDSTGTNTWNLKNISDNGSGSFGGVSEVGITDGLVGYWKLNGDARDYSGNNNHGTVIEAIVSSGLKNQAYSFDGVNDRIMITQPTPPIATKEITTSAWVYPTVPANPGVKIRGGAISGHANMYLGLVDTGTAWNLHWALETTVSRPGSWSGTIPINQWTYITGTYDGAYMRAYINGVEVWSTALTGNIAYQSDYVIGTYIGALADGNHNFFGKITDVRIYNRALSVDEINILYKQGTPLTGMQLASDGTLYLNNEIKEGF